MRKCVVIGCGWAGTHHMYSVKFSQNAELLAAVQHSEKRRQEVLHELSIPVFASLDELFEKGPDFDTAIVATLPPSHFELCMQLIDSGKDILCEKPVCRNSIDIALLSRRAQKQGTRFGVIFNQRYGAAVLYAKNQLKNDKSQRHLLNASMYQHLPDKIEKHVDKYFMITDACCHLLDLATWLCGPATVMSALSTQLNSEIISDVSILLSFDNGCIGTISHSNVGGLIETQHPYQTVDIHTEIGRYTIDNHCGRYTFSPHDKLERQIYEPSVFLRRDYIVSLRKSVQDFLFALDSGDQLPAGLTDAYTNMLALERVIELIS